METDMQDAQGRTEQDPLAHVLMVDDDPGIRDAVSDFLRRHGYAVETAADGQEMEAMLSRGSIDLIVLDIMLPGEDGLAICRRMAGGEAPAIIMLSAMGDETDRIIGLELGADDYLPKPCNPRELLARIRAVLRRRQEPRRRATRRWAPAAASPAGGWTWSDASCVRPRGDRQPVERRVHPAAGVHRAAAAGADPRPPAGPGPRPDSDAYDRAIDVQISRLRRKLDDGVGGQELIRTVRNEGYVFTARVTRT